MRKKKQRTGHISEAISPTDFILGTMVQPNNAHSMTQVSTTYLSIITALCDSFGRCPLVMSITAIQIELHSYIKI